MNNKGSALINVMVATVFMAIIATILIYVSGKNLQIRFTDYRNKQNFYGAEEVMDEIKEGLIMDCSSASKKAYQATMKEFMGSGDEEHRKQLYQESFVNELEKLWQDRLQDQTYLDAIKGLATIQEQSRESIKEVSGDAPEFNSQEGYIVIKDIKVTSSNVEGFVTSLSSDIVISAPEISWSVDSSKKWTDSDEEIERNEIEVSKYVMYQNWRH